MCRVFLLGSSLIKAPESNSTTLEPRAYRHMLLHLASSVQLHSSSHHSSCSKISQRTGIKGRCRFNMPADVCQATKMTMGHGTVIIKRTVSNIYLNAFNEALLLALKSNHEVQLLFGVGGCIALYYVVGYSTKPQNRFDQLPLMSLARSLERRIAAEAADHLPRDKRVIVQRRLSSLGRTLVSEQEIRLLWLLGSFYTILRLILLIRVLKCT